MKRFTFCSLLAMAALSFARVGADPVDLQIDRSRQKFNLGFSDFAPDGRIDASVVDAYQTVVYQDLDFSRLFNLVSKGPLVKSKTDALEWAKFGSEMVLSGQVRERAADKLEITVRLTDTKSGKEVASFGRKGGRADIRVQAHDLSNEIVKYFTGKPGVFNSKIVFSNDATGRKELYIADYDGRNLKRLTNDNSIVILPRISPNGERIVFTSYKAGNPDLYIINRDGSGRRKISSQKGLNVSPSWAPNNEELAITLSESGPPNIYLINAQGVVQRRLTDAQTADTAPSFSPDGSQIAFTSDRAGAPHIYVMNLDGSGLRRITTASHCDSAAWSPDGQTILYVKSEARGKFDIYSIEVLTGLERRLTWGSGDSENPAWSPDGRFILFTSNRNGRMQLFIMLADGSEQRSLPSNSGQSFTPHWSL